MTDIPTLQTELDATLAHARAIQAAIVQARIMEANARLRSQEGEPGALLYSAIGNAIREVRKAAGLSQAVLAAAVNVTRTSIVNIEAGRQRLPIDLLFDISDILNVQATALLPRNEDV